MAIQWEKLALRIEQLIRSGKSALVVEEFGRLKKVRVPREMIERFAKLSYRGNVSEFGLRILNPYVRSETPKSSDATPGEICEYAFGLTRAGASEEAFELLEKLDASKFAKVDYYKACVYISQTDYAASIPLLEKYISAGTAEFYERIVAEVNLAAAYVYVGEASKVDALLDEIIRVAQWNRFQLVLGKAMQLKAENFLNLKQWEEFDLALSDADNLFRLASSRERFFVKKLALQRDLELEPSSFEVRKRLTQLKAEALEMRHYESVRDLDRLQAISSSDTNLFLKLYFGTPYACYKEKLIREFKKKVEIPNAFEWQLSEKAGDVILDLAQSTFGKGKTAFDVGSVPHRLLVALSKDFYVPQRIAVLHHHLYPGEYFNPVTSPARVHRAMRRLRDYLEASNVPLLILEEGGFFALYSKKPASIKVYAQQEDFSTVSGIYFELIKHYSEKPFSVAEASEKLQIPARTFSRQLKQCLEEGKVRRVGTGKKTRYFVDLPQKAA